MTTTIISEIKENRKADRAIKAAVREFGVEVKALADNRQTFVMGKLQAEIERLRPMADRLLHGER